MSSYKTAADFIDQLQSHQSNEELQKIQRYFKTDLGEYAADDKFIGVKMGQVFALAKEFIDITIDEIEHLLESPIHEARAGGLKIMALQAVQKKATADDKEALFKLYIRRHDRINNWDLVDLAARDVIGGYLFDKQRDKLTELAQSDNVWERRTAIYALLFFIKRDDLDDTFRIAELVLNDQHDLIHKAMGGVLREAGKHDRQKLVDFLDQYAVTMPATMLRYAIQHFEKDERRRYRNMRKNR